MVAVLSFVIVGVPHILHNKTRCCIASVVPWPLVVEMEQRFKAERIEIERKERIENERIEAERLENERM